LDISIAQQVTQFLHSISKMKSGQFFLHKELQIQQTKVIFTDFQYRFFDGHLIHGINVEHYPNV
jgi:hypothetical protein